jgi:hypothetical protein
MIFNLQPKKPDDSAWVEIDIREFWGLYPELLKGQEKRA